MGVRLGSYLQTLRQQQRTSIRQLGCQVGLSPSYLSLLERGQRETSLNNLYPLILALKGNFNHALRLLALDAGVPEEVVSRQCLDLSDEET